MKRLFLVKTCLIAVSVLFCALCGYGLILAQQAQEYSEPLIGMRAKTIAQIAEMEKRQGLSPEEQKILQDLKRNQKEIEKKIDELKIDLVYKPAEQAREQRIREKELSLTASSQAAMQEAIQQKELALTAKDERDSKEAIKQKELALTSKDEQAKEQRTKEKEPSLAAQDQGDPSKTDSALLKAKNRQTEDELNEQCLTCEAVATNTIAPCAEIQDQARSKRCRQFLMSVRMFEELKKSKKVTAAGLKLCQEAMGSEDQAKCKAICQAYLTRDFKPVMRYFQDEDAQLGLALLSGDSKHCTYAASEQAKQEDCLSNAYFSSAIRSNNKKLCSEIDNPQMQIICQAYFDKNGTQCEDFKNKELVKRRENLEKTK